MGKENVFAYENELGRLSTQNRLMIRYEEPSFRNIFSGRSGLRVLDVGCNDGEKTFRWFSDPAVARVIGLEINEKLVEHAREAYGGEVFRFHACDVDAEEFPARLGEILRQEKSEGFDVIYVSYLLSHLRSPETLLRLLRPLLNPGGVLVAADVDDSSCFLSPEGNELFQEYLSMFAQDPYAGDRSMGRRLPELLRDCGYCDVVQCFAPPDLGPEDLEFRRYLFTCYTFLEEDLPLLRISCPDDALYDRMEAWLAKYFPRMKDCFLAEDATVTGGFTMYSCTTNHDTMGRERSMAL